MRRRLTLVVGIGAVPALLLFLAYWRLVEISVPVLQWDDSQQGPRVEILMDPPNDSNLVRLREDYKLDQLVADAADQYESLRRIVHWVHQRWEHSGSSVPSKPDPLTILREASEGKRFRCVEYATVAVACARALGMPARVLALKRKNVETAKAEAGHVVAEVWLDQFDKWVFVDPQFDAIPELDGVPLDAVQLQQAIAEKRRDLRFGPDWSRTRRALYVRWIAPYLFYFDFALDQRMFVERNQKRRGRIMLVPLGAKKPTVFQRKYPIRDCRYISDPHLFYPEMRAEKRGPGAARLMMRNITNYN